MGGIDMSKTILQINFKFSIPLEKLGQDFAPLTEPISKVPGLSWKIWTANPAESEFAGIYLFDGPESAQTYLGGPIIAGVKAHPAISDISAKLFTVLDEFSAITRGPV
jgi:hypothetical protein